MLNETQKTKQKHKQTNKKSTKKKKTIKICEASLYLIKTIYPFHYNSIKKYDVMNMTSFLFYFIIFLKNKIKKKVGKNAGKKGAKEGKRWILK